MDVTYSRIMYSSTRSLTKSSVASATSAATSNAVRRSNTSVGSRSGEVKGIQGMEAQLKKQIGSTSSPSLLGAAVFDVVEGAAAAVAGATAGRDVRFEEFLRHLKCSGYKQVST